MATVRRMAVRGCPARRRPACSTPDRHTLDAEGTRPMVTDLTMLALAVLGSSVVAGLIGTLLGNTRANAAARRERYAQAVRTLVAWAEYPYRIRRRTSDDATALSALAERGHTLQEQLAESRAWIA